MLYKSHNSIIYKCVTDKCEEIVIKKFLDKKYFDTSIIFYNNFPKLPLCHLYDVDNKNEIQILEYVEGVTISRIKDYKKRLKVGFEFLNSWSFCVKTMEIEELMYSKIVDNMLNECSKITLFFEAKILLNNFKKYFENFNSKYNTSYLIHGDLHYDNLIYNGKNLIAIDPSPKIASFAIEVAKLIENELFIDVNLIEEKLNQVIKIFKFDIIGEEELLEGLFIDSCRRTFDSYLRGDDEQTFIKGIKVNNEILNFLERRKMYEF